MKLTTRGFTLVELMIVIAIIGILAAALFPSLTAYLARGRDTSRLSGIKEINTALSGYQLDKSALPTLSGGTAGGNCVNKTELDKYIVKFPVDPIATRTNSCGVAGAYGYGTGTDNGGTLSYALSAILENNNGGNTGAISAYQTDAIPNGVMMTIDAFAKGTGSGYVVRN